ncbi:5-oxoprolinase-like, partial [Stegodyphus dumicola]|uniref:5-oxoprolinase-like n=1 Tax=Stegodyphus dumicola TaxID=202533 RepID=UPI0015AF1D08
SDSLPVHVVSMPHGTMVAKAYCKKRLDFCFPPQFSGTLPPPRGNGFHLSKIKCVINFFDSLQVTCCYFEEGYADTDIYVLDDLCYGHEITGPAIIIDANCTILVEPYCVASVTKDGSIFIKVGDENEHKTLSLELDMIHLSIFSHRFMSIAEQMGKILQRTSVSTNIKERLDFSCALFGPDGGLVSNAPHIPVHLGAMQEAVQFQLKYLGDSIHNGDVILSNHPCAGGSHLPDLTVITPVFYGEFKKPVFFVACRGHHADIGGLTPGSMPPHSRSLLQEGATFVSFKLVKDGAFQEEGKLL